MNDRKDNRLRLNGRVRIGISGAPPSPVRHALRMLVRDIEVVLGAEPELVTGRHETADIYIRLAEEQDNCAQRPEAFGFRFHSDGSAPCMSIIGRDELGLVYGILEFSRIFLGIEPFWFWMDQAIVPRYEIDIPCENYDSPASKVRFRGWFVNDEVCLIG
jgi:hypothetical protein